MLPATAIFLLGCLATLSTAFPAEEAAVQIVPSIEMVAVPDEQDSYRVAAAASSASLPAEASFPVEEDSYRAAASPLVPSAEQTPPHDPEAPDHALAPPPADHVAPASRAVLFSSEQPAEQQELVREKRQFGYGYGRRGYGRRGYGRRHGYGGYGGGYPGYYGGGYGGYPGGYGGYGGYPGGGFGGSSAQSAAQSSSFSIGGGFGPFTGSISSSQASSSAGGFGFGR